MAGELEYYVRLWNLEILGDTLATASGCITPVRYRKKTAMLKQLNVASDEEHAWKLLSYWQGIHAVALLAYEKSALLLEGLEKWPSLKKMVLEGQDDKATEILAGVVMGLHGTQGPAPEGLIPLNERFHALFRRVPQSEDSNPLYLQAAEIARMLIDSAVIPTVLHGDLHHENVLYSLQGWKAIDPKGIIGDPVYDVANILCNPYPLKLVYDEKRMRRQRDILCEQLNFNKDRVAHFVFAHSMLAACWSLEDGENPAYWLLTAETARKLL